MKKFSAIEKQASTVEDPLSIGVKQAEANFEGNLSGFGFLGIEKIASAAKDMFDRYGDAVTSDQVKRYAGRAYLNKEAAVLSLANRYHASKDTDFVKIAQMVVNSVRENDFDNIGRICETVTSLDKKAGLDIIGFNFYKEALLTKQSELASSLKVNLAGTSVPWESIQKFGKERIASTMGKDIADGLTGDPANDKAVLESLPIDLQKMLASLVKGV